MYAANKAWAEQQTYIVLLSAGNFSDRINQDYVIAFAQRILAFSETVKTGANSTVGQACVT